MAKRGGGGRGGKRARPKIVRGPRGGKYRMSGGKKVYIGS